MQEAPPNQGCARLGFDIFEFSGEGLVESTSYVIELNKPWLH
jgi:hypothetical protein